MGGGEGEEMGGERRRGEEGRVERGGEGERREAKSRKRIKEQT